jgi:anti-anti-sigma regulatory factor
VEYRTDAPGTKNQAPGSTVDIHIAYREHALVLELPEEFCRFQADPVITRLARVLSASRTSAVTLDMTATRLINTEGLTVLRSLADIAEQRRTLLTAVVPNPHLRRLLHVLELGAAMTLYEHWPVPTTAGQSPTAP